MKLLFCIAIFSIVGCSDVQQQVDKVTTTSKEADSVLNAVDRVDQSLRRAKHRIDSSMPSRQQEDSLLNLPRKMKRKIDSLVQ